MVTSNYSLIFQYGRTYRLSNNYNNSIINKAENINELIKTDNFINEDILQSNNLIYIENIGYILNNNKNNHYINTDKYGNIFINYKNLELTD